MTFGTAKLTRTQTGYHLVYLNPGSFLVGERTYGNINAALRFCRERGIKVVETRGFE